MSEVPLLPRRAKWRVQRRVLRVAGLARSGGEACPDLTCASEIGRFFELFAGTGAKERGPELGGSLTKLACAGDLACPGYRGYRGT